MTLGMLLLGFVAVLGLVIGSFLNVCIHRLPRGESVIWPASRCPRCGQSIAWYDDIPLLNFLWLQGHCRKCRSRISFRYPIVEFMNGLGYVMIVEKFGWEWMSLGYAVFFSNLVVIALIDFEHQIIPDVITLPGVVVGLVCSATIFPIGMINAMVGVALGLGHRDPESLRIRKGRVRWGRY